MAIIKIGSKFTDGKLIASEDYVNTAVGSGGGGSTGLISVADLPIDNKPAILIPLYIYPGTAWDDLIVLARKYPNTEIIAIVNPNSGQGASLNTDYVTGIRELRSAGIKVWIYVATDYPYDVDHNTKVVQDCKDDIDDWISFYPEACDGIFLDEMTWIETSTSTDADNVKNFYYALKDYGHEKGFPIVMGNPGTSVPLWYYDDKLCDSFMMYESNGFPSEATVRDTTKNTESLKSQRCIVTYGDGIYNDTEFEMITKYAKYVFCNDIPTWATNAWGDVTTTLESQVKVISTSTDIRTAIAGLQSGVVGDITTKSASFTFALTDANDFMKCTNSSDINATVPPNSSVAFSIGTVIDLAQYGAGAVTFVQGSGVTIRSKNSNKKTDGQYSGVTLKKIGTDEWLLIGALTI